MLQRQMEEIREARRKEAEARQEQKKSKLVRQLPPCMCSAVLTLGLQEETKDSLRKRRKRKIDADLAAENVSSDSKKPQSKPKKRVSFG